MEQLAVTVLDDARSAGDERLTCLGAALASIAALSQGRIDRGRGHLARAQAGFDALSDERLVARLDLCGWVGLAALRLERPEQALEPVARGIALARATGHGSTFPGLLTLQCRALLAAGRVTEANRVAEAATDAATLTGNDNLVIAASEAAAMASMWAGEPERALESARSAVACLARVGNSYFAPLANLALAAALHANGDAAAARAELASLDSARARELLELSGAYGLELLTRVDLELGELDAAAEAAMRAELRACEVGLPIQRATAGCASAAVLLAQGETRAAARAGATAATGAEAAGNPLLAGRAHALAGIALASTGDRDAGIAALERALALLTACGAAGEAQRAARHLRRLGRPVARSRRSTTGKSWGALSPREREVADHVAAGQTNREVAAALFLSEKTIESHLSRIYEKLGIHSRSALAATMARAPALSGPRDELAP
jgi:DNA-binding CsgD family transcriptional regulator